MEYSQGSSQQSPWWSSEIICACSESGSEEMVWWSDWEWESCRSKEKYETNLRLSSLYGPLEDDSWSCQIRSWHFLDHSDVEKLVEGLE